MSKFKIKFEELSKFIFSQKGNCEKIIPDLIPIDSVKSAISSDFGKLIFNKIEIKEVNLSKEDRFRFNTPEKTTPYRGEVYIYYQ